MSLKGGSFGLQVGSQETNLLLLIMNRSAESKLLDNDFTIGLDASAAAGPVGRSVGAQTNTSFNAEILSWSQSSGLFAGISLQGGALRTGRFGSEGDVWQGTHQSRRGRGTNSRSENRAKPDSRA